MTKFYVAHFEMDYADEFDVDGLSVLTEEEYKNAQDLEEKFKALPNLMDDSIMYVGFGSNEELEAYPSEFFESMSYTEITEDEYKTLQEYADETGLVTPKRVLENLNYELETYINEEN